MKILYWTLRILAIVAILFMMMFSLDCFEEEVTKNILICLSLSPGSYFYFIIICTLEKKFRIINH